MLALYKFLFYCIFSSHHKVLMHNSDLNSFSDLTDVPDSIMFLSENSADSDRVTITSPIKRNMTRIY